MTHGRGEHRGECSGVDRRRSERSKARDRHHPWGCCWNHNLVGRKEQCGRENCRNETTCSPLEHDTEENKRSSPSPEGNRRCLLTVGIILRRISNSSPPTGVRGGHGELRRQQTHNSVQIPLCRNTTDPWRGATSVLLACSPNVCCTDKCDGAPTRNRPPTESCCWKCIQETKSPVTT